MTLETVIIHVDDRHSDSGTKAKRSKTDLEPRAGRSRTRPSNTREPAGGEGLITPEGDQEATPDDMMKVIGEAFGDYEYLLKV